MTILKSREALLALAIVVSVGIISTRFPAFVMPGNLANVFNDTAPLMLLAIGQMIVILTKCIDLSVAANLALTDAILDGKAPAGLADTIVLNTAVGLWICGRVPEVRTGRPAKRWANVSNCARSATSASNASARVTAAPMAMWCG